MSGLTQAVGRGVPDPNGGDVLLVQQLLNRQRRPPFRPIAEDGVIGTETIAAIEDFQRRVIKMERPDGRVDPGGATFRALSAGGAAPQSPTMATAAVMVTFKHQFKSPTGVTGLPGADDKTTATRYESLVTVAGGPSGSFSGSIYPDNMNVKGRLKDGSYDLYLGFHKAGTPTASDLVVRTNHFRAVLVVNANKMVPVVSNNLSKTTADGIHIHNGFNTWVPETPMSEGCLILAPSDWPAFIKLFLVAYPQLADWTSGGNRLGKKIGSVAVTP